MPAADFPIHPEQNTRQTTFESVRIREDTAYSDARGKEKRGIRKRAEKSLHELRDILLKVLGPDETVLYAARAQVRPSKLEEFFLGWLAYVTHGGLLIFTNRRLLYFVTDRAGRWRKSVRTAQWGDIEKVQAKGSLSRTLPIRYRNGSTETFWRLRGDDAKKIKVLLAALLPAGTGETSPALGMVHLCPNCLAPLRAGVYQCEKCYARFKDEKTLVRRSRLLPGLGYYYAGHPGVAVLDFFIELVLLLEIAAWLIRTIRLMLLPHLSPQGTAALIGAAVNVVILVGIWAFKRWLVVRQCRRYIREFIPASN